MNKYLLAGLCLLAFVAGGAAQLALRGSGGTTLTAGNVVERSEGAGQSLVGRRDELPARPPEGPAAPVREGTVAGATPAVATEDVAGGVKEKSGGANGQAANVSGVSTKRTKKTVYRRDGGRVQTARRAQLAGRSTSTADAGGSRISASAGGAKKTGRWLGRSLKKIGDVFHE